MLTCATAGAANAQAVPTSDTGARRDSVRSLPGVAILGRPQALAALPGSAVRLDHNMLLSTRVITIADALRKVSGVNVRDEEGLGLRPNIGLRGLNPTRSTKVLLLEDGIPITIAPYGDNASYYHPPLERFDRIEVVKGAGQILYGPNTVGGVINYITPGLPARPTITAALDGGSHGFGRLHVTGRGLFQGNGVFAEFLRKRADSPARENVDSEVTDGQLKLMMSLGSGGTLVARANAYQERSRVTYSGLTETEWAAAPRQNAFANDRFTMGRVGGALTHHGAWSANASTTAMLYAYTIKRDWWRQSSNSSQRPNDASDPACGGMANLHTTCGNEGRLREYRVLGVEPRVSLGTALAGRPLQLDAGVRLHSEWQDRQQVNGQFAAARTAGSSSNPNSGIVEDNARSVRAAAAFAQGRLSFGRLTVSSGLRVEHMRLTRTNRRPTSVDPEGVEGALQLTEIIPGFGATLHAGRDVTLFWGVHRGFSPPRPEDVIDNTTGAALELPSERSWNYEMGARASVANLALDATLFALQFSDQIIPASVAGGSGAALTSAGATQHRGVELMVRADTLSTISRATLFSAASITWIPVARFDDQRSAFVGTGGSDVVSKVYAAQNAAGSRQRVLVTGTRLPYAPEFLVTGELGLRLAGGSLAIEGVHIGRQFGDPLNTRVLVPDGQQGLIASSTIWNVALGTTLRGLQTDVYVTVKNVFDKLYVVDRTRGLLPGAGRVVRLGVRRGL
ncbi:MAG: TonB-dependent receptor family protein [Gemmatimonadaceae bacterium]